MSTKQMIVLWLGIVLIFMQFWAGGQWKELFGILKASPGTTVTPKPKPNPFKVPPPLEPAPPVPVPPLISKGTKPNTNVGGLFPVVGPPPPNQHP